MKTVLRYALVAVIFVPLASLAHHSFAGVFDRGTIIEIEGDLIEVSWRNPHSHLTIERTDLPGERTTWELETNGPGILQRAGVERDAFQVGDRVLVAGFGPVDDVKEMFATNIMGRNGIELILAPAASPEPRWAEERTGDYSYFRREEGDGSSPELGLFRVWSFTNTSPGLFTEANAQDFERYPMTEAAQAALQRFDPATDNPTLNCVPKGMPTIMEQPLPMEFVGEPDDEIIQLHIEEYDLVRTINMGGEEAPSSEAASPLGYSVGRWEEATLVVTTTHLNWPWFSQTGIPQSEDSVLIERFSSTEDGSRLNYSMTVTDPVNISEPVTLENYWLFWPDEEIVQHSASCEETG